MHICLPSLACLTLGAPGLPLETTHESQSVSYDGHKAFRIDISDNLEEVKEKLAALSYDQWNFNSRKRLDISLPGDQLLDFEDLGLDYRVMHEDLGHSIREEWTGVEEAHGTFRVRQSDWFDSYHPYSDHVEYLQELHSSFPNNSEIVSQGSSLEKRDLYGLNLFGSGGNDTKEAIILHNIVHAREWITSMTLEYIANELLTGYKSIPPTAFYGGEI